MSIAVRAFWLLRAAPCPHAEREDYTGPFTTFGGACPRRAAAAVFATASRKRLAARGLAEAMCGATMTLGILSMGWPGGIGSGS